MLKSHAPKSKRKKNARDSDEKTEDFLSNQRTKMIIDFDCETSDSINSLAVNKTNVVKLTTRFFSGKMLMFAKLSLMSFKYEMLETFYFPNDKTKTIYNFYGIETTLLFHVLTNTDSTALCFIILSSENNSIPDDRFRNIIFEVIVQNDIINRFDTSNEFWEKIFSERHNPGKKALVF